jgi:hypothetical protein
MLGASSLVIPGKKILPAVLPLLRVFKIQKSTHLIMKKNLSLLIEGS